MGTEPVNGSEPGAREAPSPAEIAPVADTPSPAGTAPLADTPSPAEIAPVADAPSPAETAPTTHSSNPSTEPLVAAMTAFHEWILRPRVRLTVTGAALLLIGGLMMANSVWTLPLVIVGALMVAIAWIGPRLEGHFALEWGENGTEVVFRARIRAPEPARPALTASAADAPEPAPGREPVPEHPDAIEGEARTVEIEVAELEALIAAAETHEQGHERGREDAAVQAGRLRIAYGPSRSADAPR